MNFPPPPPLLPLKAQGEATAPKAAPPQGYSYVSLQMTAYASACPSHL